MGFITRRVVFPTAAALLAIVAAVVFSEVASRTLRLFVCEGRGPIFHIGHPAYGWTHVPNASFYSHGCIDGRYEFRAPVETNSKGLRDREYSYERAPGVPRVLVLGDSVVEAAQVALAEAFTERLEAALTAPGRPVEVINAGVAGFGIDNELLFYRAEGRKYDPDVVVAVFNIQNDVLEQTGLLHPEVNSGPGWMPKARVTLDATGRPVFDTRAFRDWVAEGERKTAETGKVRFWLHTNVYLYRWLVRHVGGRRDLPAPVALPDALTMRITYAGVFADPPSPQFEEAWRLTEALYLELARDVRASGAAFVAVIVPQREMVVPADWQSLLAMRPAGGAAWTADYPRRRMSAFFAREDIAFVDATSAMREAFAENERSGFYAFDPHPNGDGHAVIARAIEPAVRKLLAVPSMSD